MGLQTDCTPPSARCAIAIITGDQRDLPVLVMYLFVCSLDLGLLFVRSFHFPSTQNTGCLFHRIPTKTSVR
jgi:hypothetical protein